MNLRLVLCIVYAGLIFGASSVPGDDLPDFEVSDLFLHVLLYTGFGALIMWWRLGVRSLSPLGALLQTVLIGSLYGLTDEFHQVFVSNRYPDSSDLVADTLGSAIGALTLLALYVTLKRRTAKNDDLVKR